MKLLDSSFYKAFVEKSEKIYKSQWHCSAIRFIGIVTLANIFLYHQSLWTFLDGQIDLKSSGGLGILSLLLSIQVLVNFLVLALLFLVSPILVKPVCIVFALINSVALYFTATFNVILDRSMIGNILNTNADESLDLMGPKFLVYVLLFGVLPSYFLLRTRIVNTKRLVILLQTTPVILVCMGYIYFSSSSWLWIDKHAKLLGGMVMPWSYVVNSVRYKSAQYQQVREQILLPAAKSTSEEKTIIFLVVGESARAQNFSLYGYEQTTNPHLSKSGVLALKGATACSTYTTASLRCILSHQEPASMFSTQYEPLPSYLQRHGVDVIWRTNNWGEPRINVESYEKAKDLKPLCDSGLCAHDDVLLSGLETRIRQSNKQKIFVVLHQSGSHGPSYSSKYPIEHETFKPTCKSVELKNCTNQDLINAYDNTIVFTDYFLNRAINILKEFQGVSTSLVYISDHGESLGEHGIYLHGTPLSIAPKEQIEIPFLIWMSDQFLTSHNIYKEDIIKRESHSQSDIFHSILSGFNLTSDIYIEDFDVFSNTKR